MGWATEYDIPHNVGGRNAPWAGAGMVSVLAETVVFVPDTPEAKCGIKSSLSGIDAGGGRIEAGDIDNLRQGSRESLSFALGHGSRRPRRPMGVGTRLSRAVRPAIVRRHWPKARPIPQMPI